MSQEVKITSQVQEDYLFGFDLCVNAWIVHPNNEHLHGNDTQANLLTALGQVCQACPLLNTTNNTGQCLGLNESSWDNSNSSYLNQIVHIRAPSTYKDKLSKQRKCKNQSIII